MAAETLSSQEQSTFMPPGHFAKVIVQRGTIIMFIPGEAGACVPTPAAGPDIGMPVIGIPGIPVPVRSIVFVAAILVSFAVDFSCCNPQPPGKAGSF